MTSLRGTSTGCGHIDIGQRFAAFHHANPDILTELLRLARHARDDGATRIGMKALWEVMRWNRRGYRPQIAAGGPKFNNDYTALYARLIVHTDPSLEGLFETRGDIELPASVTGPAQTSLEVAA